MADDAATELARQLASKFGLQQSPMAKGGMLLNAILGTLGKSAEERNKASRVAPPINKPLPRIVPDGKGNLIDLNTGGVVGKVGPQSKAATPGLLQHALDYAYSGLKQAGETAAGQTRKSGDILRAVQAGKSIPKGQSGSLLQSALGMAPMGMISPANWASTEPEVKALINVLGDKFPNFFKKILGDPRELLTLTAPSKAADMGPLASSLGEYVPLSGGASGGIKLSPDIFSNIEGTAQPVLAHEMQHYLNAAMPEFKGTASTVSGAIDPAVGDKYERIASMIHDQLPRGGRGSLSQRLGQSMFLKSGGVPQELEGLVQKAGSPQALLPHLQKAAFDEALAHLTEHTVRQGTPQGLLDLATQMGVGAQ